MPSCVNQPRNILFYTCKSAAAAAAAGNDAVAEDDDGGGGDFYRSSPPSLNPWGGVSFSVDGVESSIPPIACPCWSPYPF